MVGYVIKTINPLHDELNPKNLVLDCENMLCRPTSQIFHFFYYISHARIGMFKTNLCVYFTQWPVGLSPLIISSVFEWLELKYNEQTTLYWVLQ